MTPHTELLSLIEKYQTRAANWDRVSTDYAQGHAKQAADIVADLRALARAEQGSNGWIDLSVCAPADGELVVVYVPDKGDGDRYDFDYMEEGVWGRHEDDHQHFMAVGGAAAGGADCVCIGPPEEAPYTHWRRLGVPGATPPPSPASGVGVEARPVRSAQWLEDAAEDRQPTHLVRRGPAQGYSKYEEIPCGCAATMDHSIGREVAAPQPEAAQPAHPDDVAVDLFAAAMKAKMAKQRAKGYGGWNDPADCAADFLRERLLVHFGKGDPVDVGNFAMMLFNRGESTALAEAAKPGEGEAINHYLLDRLIGGLTEALQYHEAGNQSVSLGDTVKWVIADLRREREATAAIALSAASVPAGAEIVGHKTFHDGQSGFRHEPLTRAEADLIIEHCNHEDERRKALIPDEQSALRLMMDAYIRLKEMGWNDAIYCPKDGSAFEVIETGSTGIFKCMYEGEWPRGSWWVIEDGDMCPSRPILYRPIAALAATVPEGMPCATCKGRGYVEDGDIDDDGRGISTMEDCPACVSAAVDSVASTIWDGMREYGYAFGGEAFPNVHDDDKSTLRSIARAAIAAAKGESNG